MVEVTGFIKIDSYLTGKTDHLIGIDKCWHVLWICTNYCIMGHRSRYEW